MEFTNRILLVGGSGTLGQAFMQKAQDEEWKCELTCFSRSWSKQIELKHKFPEVKFVVGDILSFEHLKLAMVGHDLVIHMAAMKHVVIGEQNAISVFETNVEGSRNVLEAATQLGIDVVGISSDKACKPVNAYGASKMMMERMFQQYALTYEHINYHLVRYGNVFGSTGSFVHSWLADMASQDYVTSTDDEMTRFWLTADDALQLIYHCLQEPSGCTLIPKAKAAKIGDIEEWLIPEEYEVKHMGARPGEKKHECLLSMEEGMRAEFIEIEDVEYVRLYPAIMPRNESGLMPRRSNSSSPSVKMSKEEFLKISGLDIFDADDHS